MEDHLYVSAEYAECALPGAVPPPVSPMFHAVKRSAYCTTTEVCSEVVVPLDRTGVVPGTVTLHVEVVPSVGVSRGAIFLIAGGPGQGSAHVFGLGTPSVVADYRYLFPGYTLVAYDDRGTGD